MSIPQQRAGSPAEGHPSAGGAGAHEAATLSRQAAELGDILGTVLFGLDFAELAVPTGGVHALREDLRVQIRKAQVKARSLQADIVASTRGERR